MDLDVGLWGSVIAWNFLPNFVTNFLHARYYDLRYARNSRSVPQPGQKKYVRDRGWIYLTVVLAYLAYTLHQVGQDETDFDILKHVAESCPHSLNRLCLSVSTLCSNPAEPLLDHRGQDG
jgi:hypothetical protein